MLIKSSIYNVDGAKIKIKKKPPASHQGEMCSRRASLPIRKKRCGKYCYVFKMRAKK